jgi:hypothetical protein
MHVLRRPVETAAHSCRWCGAQRRAAFAITVIDANGPERTLVMGSIAAVQLPQSCHSIITQHSYGSEICYASKPTTSCTCFKDRFRCLVSAAVPMPKPRCIFALNTSDPETSRKVASHHK